MCSALPAPPAPSHGSPHRPMHPNTSPYTNGALPCPTSIFSIGNDAMSQKRRSNAATAVMHAAPWSQLGEAADTLFWTLKAPSFTLAPVLQRRPPRGRLYRTVPAVAG
jgi:hypothetical protein